MTLLGLIVVPIVLGLVLYLVDTLPIAPPLKLAVRVLIVVVVILWLLASIGLVQDLNTPFRLR